VPEKFKDSLSQPFFVAEGFHRPAQANTCRFKGHYPSFKEIWMANTTTKAKKRSNMQGSLDEVK